MNKEKRIFYISAFATLAVLLLVFFIPTGNTRWIAAGLLAVITPAVWILNKKRSIPQLAKRDVLIIMSLVAVLYVALLEMSGLFMDFYKNPYFVSSTNLLNFVLPILVIIITTEFVRRVFLSRGDKLGEVLAYLSCVMAEVLTYSNLTNITSLNRFMDLVGLTLFPALCANLLYNYVSKRYGLLPNLVFRLITTLYIYFIPVSTGMSDSLKACVKIVFPIILLALISAMFEKKKKNAVRKGKKASAIGTVFVIVCTVAIAMLISCQFYLGALVIATESMTGEINKGDVIIYERYEGQSIEEGQVIVFNMDDYKIVHRVVRIETIGSETRYYTKGDANEDLDNGYRTESDIFGLTDVKIPYVGYPSLWLRELIQN